MHYRNAKILLTRRNRNARRLHPQEIYMAQQLNMDTLCEDAWRTQVEEVMFLRSIYSKTSECTLHLPYEFDTLELQTPAPSACRQPISLTLRINNCLTHNKITSLNVRFELPSNYPALPPLVSLSSNDLCEATVSELQEDVNRHVSTYCHDPCIFSTAEYIKGKLDGVLQEELPLSRSHYYVTISDPKQPQTECLSPSQKKSICISHLDHIHCEARYIKTLKTWTQELSLWGLVIHAGLHFIYVIMIGNPSALHKLLRRWRTALIDVDARGRPCKERLLSVLCQQDMDSCQLPDGVSEFELVHCGLKDVASYFAKDGLGNLFEMHVKPTLPSYCVP